MRHFVILLFVLINISCKKNPESFIEHINGYWEIEKVILASGEERDYTYNEFIDYFQVSDDLKGIRKKLKPTLRGTFETTDDSENFILKIENDSLNIYYKTLFSSWKETILLATNQKLKIIDSHKNVFIYKQYKSLNLN
tara:strand:- start:220 stop:636 length:417 start_codon:yes stop_codon:yes gene_type:complete